MKLLAVSVEGSEGFEHLPKSSRSRADNAGLLLKSRLSHPVVASIVGPTFCLVC